MSWGSPVTILEGEDEEALKSRFVELCALYPDRTHLEIGEYVFRDLKDPILRGAQAGAYWGRDIQVQERIRAYRQTGGKSEKELPSKETLALEILALARDTVNEPKDRIAAYKQAAEVLGYVVKQVDKKVENKSNAAEQLALIADRLPG